MGKSTWLSGLGAHSPWVDGDSLVDWQAPDKRGPDGKLSEAFKLRWHSAIEDAVRSGRLVLVNVEDETRLAGWRDCGYLRAAWITTDPHFASERLVSAKSLKPVQITSLSERFYKVCRKYAKYAPEVFDSNECPLPSAGFHQQVTIRSGAQLARRLAKHAASLFASKELAPAHVDHTPGQVPPQACLCPLGAAVESVLAIGVAGTDVCNLLLKRLGEPYDFVTGMLLYWGGVGRNCSAPSFLSLLSLPYQEFAKAAKEASGLIKRWGVCADWHLSPSDAAELHCIGARGVGTIDLQAEKEHRSNLEFAASPPPERIFTLTRDFFDRELKRVKDVRHSPEEYFARRAFNIAGGSQPSGSQTWPAGAVSADGSTSELKFRHTKKSWAESVTTDYLDKVLAGPARIRATFSIKINDPSKVRVLYGCDTESYLAYAYVLGPIEAGVASDEALLRPGASDELAHIRDRLDMLAEALGFMYDFDDFNSQHSYASMKAVFQGLRASKWVLKQPAEYQQAVTWCVDALDDLEARYPDGSKIRQPLGMMSGWRATSFVNTMLNWAYISNAVAAAQLAPDDLAGIHAGDDYYGTVKSRESLPYLLASLKAQGNRGQESKTAISREFGEFLRCRYSKEGVNGYVARTIASLATGNFMGLGVSDPLAKAAEVAEHVSTCVTRGMCPRLGADLALRLARYWGAVKDGEAGPWVRPPDSVLYCSRSMGGLGLVLQGGQLYKWHSVSLPKAPVRGREIKFRTAPRLATNDASALVWAELEGLGFNERDFERLNQAMLRSSYDASALRALRQKLGPVDYLPLAAWYRDCRDVASNSPGRARYHEAVVTEAMTTDDGPLQTIEDALQHRSLHTPAIYGSLSKISGLRDVTAGSALDSPEGTRALLACLKPQHLPDYDRHCAYLGKHSAKAITWGRTDTHYIAAFGLSRLVRDYAWLAFRARRMRLHRSQIKASVTELTFAASLTRLTNADIPGVGRVRA
jgi:hypothetical protein